MKKLLLLTAVACCVPVVSPVARAQAVNVYVSKVSVLFPDPAGVDDISSQNQYAVEVMLGFVAPQGCQFIKDDGKSKVGVTDGLGAKRNAEVNKFFTYVPDSGAFAKCPLRLKQLPVFPLKLDGVVEMKISEGTKALPAQAFDARKGAKFKVEGMEITVNEVTDQGKAFGQLELKFKNTLDVKEITLTDDQGGKLDSRCISTFSTTFPGSVPSTTCIYKIRNMPARMKAVVSVNKGVKDIDVPVKLTVDLNTPAK
ncbi:hypothetical protein [uncultured Akkermansia sp.]|uniref:hypothetical protein n=1 Tax=uncultured Akkermansia sp. TaxID=512294 RepID=UPI00265CE4C2|nr:hypothetical protein [uncultured Akkermansia sp.]